MPDNNVELQQQQQSDMGSRTRPCLGDKNETPHQKKQQKSCSEERSHHESNGGGETDAAENSKGLTTKAAEEAAAAEEDTGRERLKRHRVEVAGRVWIPENWGQEDLLKDWIDCCGFDASLMNSNVMSAREALMEEGRRASSSRLRIENSC